MGYSLWWESTRGRFLCKDLVIKVPLTFIWCYRRNKGSIHKRFQNQVQQLVIAQWLGQRLDALVNVSSFRSFTRLLNFDFVRFCAIRVYVQYLFMYNTCLCTILVYMQYLFMYSTCLCAVFYVHYVFITNTYYRQFVWMFNTWMCAKLVYVQNVRCCFWFTSDLLRISKIQCYPSAHNWLNIKPHCTALSVNSPRRRSSVTFLYQVFMFVIKYCVLVDLSMSTWHSSVYKTCILVSESSTKVTSN